VVASGLNNPRGLKFGPDGNIYVAEAGTGGTTSTVGTCAQVPPPVGPYTGSTTGSRISMITPAGARTTVVDNLPSAQDAIPPNPDVIGAADVAFLGNTLYGLESGAGCSHGVSSIPNNVFKANADGSWTQVADLSAFLQAHPVAKPNAADFEPDGTWYSMVASGGNLYAVEPNHGELDKVSPDGTVTRVADISATEGHSVPTSVAVGPDGNFYVGNLFHFPIASGDAEILKITPSGQVTHYAMGLTAVVGLAFDSKGNLFALELSAAPPAGSPAPLVPGTGRVVEVSSSGTITQVAGGLTLPGAMTIGPDNAIYVTNNGSGAPGSGQVVRIAHP
jgi:sugar lactone lactonase YvrE